MFWNPWRTFVTELIFSNVLGLLSIALLKKLLHRYFARSLIIDFRMPIFIECLSFAALKITNFWLLLRNRYLYVEIDIFFSTRLYFPSAEVKEYGPCINLKKLQTKNISVLLSKNMLLLIKKIKGKNVKKRE